MTPIHSFAPFVSTGKDSPAFWFVDILWVVHATGEQTQGAYSVIEQRMPEGSGPPPHVHPFEDETFWVMEGEIDGRCRRRDARPGARLDGPRTPEQRPLLQGDEGRVPRAELLQPGRVRAGGHRLPRPAESRTLPPEGLDPFDSPQVIRFFNNYWIAPADAAWAVQKFTR